MHDSGLCYIGRSGLNEEKGRTVANRLLEWLNVAFKLQGEPAGPGHSGAYAYEYPGVKELLGSHGLEVSARFLPVGEDGENILAAEKNQLTSYRKRHGELPPFNSTDPDYRGIRRAARLRAARRRAGEFLRGPMAFWGNRHLGKPRFTMTFSVTVGGKSPEFRAMTDRLLILRLPVRVLQGAPEFAAT